MSQHTPAHNVIVQIKVKLLGVSKPPVWRQLQLRADTRLDQLHEILQAALGWENYHMHVFSFGEEEFGVPDPELGDSATSAGHARRAHRHRHSLPLHLRLRRRLAARDPRRRPARPRPRHPLPDPRGREGSLPARGLRQRLGIRQPQRDPRRPQPRRTPRHARVARTQQRQRIRPQRRPHRATSTTNSHSAAPAAEHRASRTR